jgi:uncharacterized membrane protein
MAATVLRKIEAIVFFLAMLLAVVLEGGIVYWLCRHPAGQGGSFGITGQWTGVSLPQAWIFGAFWMLGHKLIVMFTSLGCTEGKRERKDFLRLWRWAIALIAMQSFAFFLGRVAGA